MMARLCTYLTLILVAAIHCGDSAAPEPTKKAGGEEASAPKKAPVAADKSAAAPVAAPGNPKWASLRVHFDHYVHEPLLSHKDVFKDNLLKYVTKVATPIAEEQEEKEEEPAVAQEPKTPLEKFPVESYKLIMIISGTGMPKAWVIDPSGDAHVIFRDTRIGNKNGIVESISQYQVVIREPEREEPVTKSIEPPLSKIGDALLGRRM